MRSPQRDFRCQVWRTGEPRYCPSWLVYFFFLLKFHLGLSNLWSFRILTVKTPIRSEHVVREQFLASLFPRWFLVRYEGGQQCENGLLVSSRLTGCEALGGREEESVRWWVFSAARMLKLNGTRCLQHPRALCVCWLQLAGGGASREAASKPNSAFLKNANPFHCPWTKLPADMLNLLNMYFANFKMRENAM